MGEGTGEGKGCRCASGARFRGLTRAAGAMSAFPSALRFPTHFSCRSWLLFGCSIVFLILSLITTTIADRSPSGNHPRISRRQVGGDDVHRLSNYLDDHVAVYDDGEILDDLDDDYFETNITAGERNHPRMPFPIYLPSYSSKILLNFLLTFLLLF